MSSSGSGNVSCSWETGYRFFFSLEKCKIWIIPLILRSGFCLSSCLTNQYLSVQGCAFKQKSSIPVKDEDEEEDEDEDDDIDLFGSDQDEDAEKLKEQRLKEYAQKKAKKPAIIAKSSIVLDVKPVGLPGASHTGFIS